MSKYVSLNPGNLRKGMLATAHGMLCFVDEDPHKTNHEGDRTFATSTMVLNRAKVSSDAVPYSFTAPRGEWVEGKGWTVPYHTDADHRWTFQGNDGAYIAVKLSSIDFDQPGHGEAILDQANRTWQSPGFTDPQSALDFLTGRK